MRKELTEKIEIPAGMEIEINGDTIILKKDGKEAKRKFFGFEAKKEDNFLILENKKATKNEKKLMKTAKAHINNAIRGLEKKHIYRLQVCAVHFPMSLTLDKSKGELVIKNFLGGVKPKTAKILEGVEVKVDKETIIVEGHDKEKTGQTAANIENAVKPKNRDRRVFQDGIYITEKP